MINKLGRYARQHHIALIALFVAMGGTSYAAATGSIDSREIKNNAVSSSDLRNNGVRSRDVRNGGLLKEDFKAGELPSGPQGAQGPRGFTGARGPTGATGAAFPTGNLPSGRTLRGAYTVAGNGTDKATESISYPVGLASAPIVRFLNAGGGNSSECPGSVSTPEAIPGRVCFYEQARIGTVATLSGCPPNGNVCASPPNGSVSSRWGVNLVLDPGAGATDFESYGTWAVTAP